MEVPRPAPLQELSGKEEGQVPGTEMLSAHEALHHQAEDAAGLPHMGAQAAAPAAMSHPELGAQAAILAWDSPCIYSCGICVFRRPGQAQGL